MNAFFNYTKICFFSLFLVFTGCDQDNNPVQETDEKQYQRGLSLLKQAREKEALVAFKSVIKKREFAAQSHLEVGKLYLHLMRDPVTARYHFQQFLEIRPKSVESPIVRELIKTAEKEFLKKLPGKPFKTGVNNFELQKENVQLATQNSKLTLELEKAARTIGDLRENIALLNQQRSVESNPIRSIPQNPLLTDPNFSHNNDSVAYNSDFERVRTNQTSSQKRMTTYEVQTGDTLSRISAKFYKNRKYYKIIYQANQDQMKSENDLKVGQILRIPIPKNR
tara:strand:+ start:95 stop:934 length:840 start_codon:yes stop_codon:yes gene_type:complete